MGEGWEKHVFFTLDEAVEILHCPMAFITPFNLTLHLFCQSSNGKKYLFKIDPPSRFLMQFVVSDDFNKNAVLLPLVIWQVHDRDPKDKA